MGRREGFVLTLERQILTEVNLHGLLRTLCAAFRIIDHSFLADRKSNHWRVLRPLLEGCRDVVLLRQDLLEDVVGRTCSHCYSRTASLDASPCDQVTDSEVVSVVWMGWKKVQAVRVLGPLELIRELIVLTSCQS